MIYVKFVHKNTSERNQGEQDDNKIEENEDAELDESKDDHVD